MKEKQKDILNTQSNAEETPKQNSLIIEREQIENTPFWTLKTEEGWFLVMGDYRVTEVYETKEEVLECLERDKWKIVLHLAIIVNDKFTK